MTSDVKNGATGDTRYVAQYRVKGAKVVCATHPVIGPVYWYFVSNADCNAPDYYGLTLDIDSALLTRGDWKTDLRFNRRDDFARARCLYEPAKAHGVSRAEIRSWLNTAQWESIPAPEKLYWFAGMDGFWGDRASWSEDLAEAMEFDATVALDPQAASDDLDTVAARTRGAFVLKADAQAALAALKADRTGLRKELPEPPELVFSLTITAIVEVEEYSFSEIHFSVEGNPTPDDVEELLQKLCGISDDDEDEDDDSWFGCQYDSQARTGSLGSDEPTEKFKVGSVHTRRTRSWGVVAAAAPV